MSDFSTSALLEVELSNSSLRAARNTLESELSSDPISVEATASNDLSGGGGTRMAGKERALSRQLLTESNTHLSTTTDHLSENLTLDETRNDLLRDLVEAQELTAREGDQGGRMRSLGSAGLGGGAAGLLIVGTITSQLASVNWGSVIGDAVPDVDIGPDDVIATAATVGAGALVGTAATIAASAVIDKAAELGAGDVIESPIGIGSDDLIDAGAKIGAGAVIANPLRVAASHLIESPVGLDARDVVEPVSLKLGDLIETPEVSPEQAVGAGAAATTGAAAWLAKRSGGLARGAGNVGSQAAGTAATAGTRAAGVAAPILTPEMQGPEAENPITGEPVPDSVLTPSGREDRLGGAGEWINKKLGTQPKDDQRSQSREAPGRNDTRRNGNSVEVRNEISVGDNGRRNDRDVERKIERRLEEFKRNLERDFS